MGSTITQHRMEISSRAAAAWCVLHGRHLSRDEKKDVACSRPQCVLVPFDWSLVGTLFMTLPLNRPTKKSVSLLSLLRANTTNSVSQHADVVSTPLSCHLSAWSRSARRVGSKVWKLWLRTFSGDAVFNRDSVED